MSMVYHCHRNGRTLKVEQVVYLKLVTRENHSLDQKLKMLFSEYFDMPDDRVDFSDAREISSDSLILLSVSLLCRI